jgi:hypothetical protein
MNMPPERLTHSTLYQMGEIQGLLMFAQALAKLHPDRDGLLRELEQAFQQGLANLEMLPEAGDVVIEGYQFVAGAIRRILGAALVIPSCMT